MQIARLPRRLARWLPLSRQQRHHDAQRGENKYMLSTTDPQEELIAEHRLWTAVIARAIDEWVSGSLRAQREAEIYLFGGGEDFKLVCYAAGLDPQALRSKLLRLKKSGAGPMPMRILGTHRVAYRVPGNHMAVMAS
jgi:hypothetical protein